MLPNLSAAPLQPTMQVVVDPRTGLPVAVPTAPQQPVLSSHLLNQHQQQASALGGIEPQQQLGAALQQQLATSQQLTAAEQQLGSSIQQQLVTCQQQLPQQAGAADPQQLSAALQQHLTGSQQIASGGSDHQPSAGPQHPQQTFQQMSTGLQKQLSQEQQLLQQMAASSQALSSSPPGGATGQVFSPASTYMAGLGGYGHQPASLPLSLQQPGSAAQFAAAAAAAGQQQVWAVIQHLDAVRIVLYRVNNSALR